MHYLLTNIDKNINNLYSKRHDITFNTFNKVSILFYNILTKTIKDLEDIYYFWILKPELEKQIKINNNERYITSMICILYLLNNQNKIL